VKQTKPNSILTRLAADIDEAIGGTVCQDAITASIANLSLVHWQFLADVLRAMQPVSDEVQAVMDPVIAGLDRLGRGEKVSAADKKAFWEAAEAAVKAPKGPGWAAYLAVAAAALAAKWAAVTGAEPFAVRVARAAKAAVDAGVPRAAQRDIMLRLIEEASE
jgi:hypothetical protein